MARATQRGPVTAKVCVLAKALRNTRFVKSAAPDPQQNQALRPSFPREPGGEVSRETIDVLSTVTATTARKLLINLTFMTDGHFAHARGHWAKLARRAPEPAKKGRERQAGVAVAARLQRRAEAVVKWTREMGPVGSLETGPFASW